MKTAITAFIMIMVLFNFQPAPGAAPAQTYQEMFNTARNHVHAGRSAQALVVLSELIASSPRADYYYYRALANSYKGDHKSALMDLNMAVSMDPGSSAYLVARGKLLVENGLYKEAIKDLSQVITTDPNNLEALFLRAKAYLNTFQEDNSYSDINSAIRIDPNNYRYYLIRADLLAMTGNYRDSLPDYDRAITLNPDCSEAYNNKGVALARLGKTREAIDNLKHAMGVSLTTPNLMRLPGFSVNAW